MNIFALDRDPRIAAEMMCDQHVVKMIIESVQMFSAVIDMNYNDSYKDASNTPPSHSLGLFGYPKSVRKHPCTLWVAKSRGNYKWLIKHTRAMCLEYSKRYNRSHKSEGLVMIAEAQMKYLDFEQEQKTEFVQAMPDDVKKKDPIQGYRNFYNLYKFAFARWQKTRPAPEWFVGGPLYFVSLENSWVFNEHATYQ